MENQEYTKINHELFTELVKYPKDSKEYQKVASAIVKNNVGLVKSIAKKYFPRIKSTTLSMEDLIAEGYFGLLEAINAFKLEKSAPFASYAILCIKNRILKRLRREVRHMRVDSLEDDKDGDKQKLKDVLESPVNLEEDFAKKYETDRKMAWVRKNLDQLTPFQRDVLIAKYFSGETMLTSEELAKEFDNTQRNITDTEHRAVKKLREIYYESHPEAMETKEAVELTNEEKTALKEVLKNLILTKLPPQQKRIMLCKFYSETEKTNDQVSLEIDLGKYDVSRRISTSFKKLCKLCDSIKDKKHLKSVLEFRSEASGKER